MVGVHGHTELSGSPDLADGGNVVRMWRQLSHRLTFSLEPVHRPFTGFAVNPNVCYGIEPVDDSWLDRVKIRDIKTCKEVFFDIANPAFNTALLIALSNGTGHNGEPIVIGTRYLGLKMGALPTMRLSTADFRLSTMILMGTAPNQSKAF